MPGTHCAGTTLSHHLRHRQIVQNPLTILFKIPSGPTLPSLRFLSYTCLLSLCVPPRLFVYHIPSLASIYPSPLPLHL
jgi:hypothetical protein